MNCPSLLVVAGHTPNLAQSVQALNHCLWQISNTVVQESCCHNHTPMHALKVLANNVGCPEWCSNVAAFLNCRPSSDADVLDPFSRECSGSLSSCRCCGAYVLWHRRNPDDNGHSITAGQQHFNTVDKCTLEISLFLSFALFSPRNDFCDNQACPNTIAQKPVRMNATLTERMQHPAD